MESTLPVSSKKHLFDILLVECEHVPEDTKGNHVILRPVKDRANAEKEIVLDVKLIIQVKTSTDIGKALQDTQAVVFRVDAELVLNSFVDYACDGILMSLFVGARYDCYSSDNEYNQ